MGSKKKIQDNLPSGEIHCGASASLAVREYARIQTFPDDWEFCGSVMSQYKQIGNAVPVNLAEALGRSLIALLNKIEETNPQIGKKRAVTLHGVRSPDRYVQPMLFEPSTLYLVHKSPVTLLGTYRKSCRDWIVANNLYNYPVTDAELDKCQYIRSVCRLILMRKHEMPLSYSVTGYSIVSKKDLVALGYNTGKNHPASQKYILYKLSPLSTTPQLDESTAKPIVGKGVRYSKGIS